MKALLVTSEVTFIPRNYDDLVTGLASCPQIGGLLVLENRDWALARKALGLMLIGVRGLGRTLLANQLVGSQKLREEAYRRENKPVWRLKTINCPEAVDLVRRESIDLIVNARTRYIYRDPILEAPPMGCINIHHGLLPEQRGTMCDLWALYERQQAGFSIHVMAKKVDAGGIIARVPVSEKDETDYLAYQRKAVKRELEEIQKVLAAIEESGTIESQPNTAPPDLRVRRNPDRKTLRAMIKSGMKL